MHKHWQTNTHTHTYTLSPLIRRKEDAVTIPPHNIPSSLCLSASASPELYILRTAATKEHKADLLPSLLLLLFELPLNYTGW